MPAQTSQSYIYFPDGCQLLAKLPTDGEYTDLGVVEGDCTASFTWDENQTETGNAGKTYKQLKNMKMELGFTLNSLNQAAIVKLGGGVMTASTTAASAVTTIPDQVIAAGWDDYLKYNLVLLTSSSDSTPLKMATKPTITSVTLDAAGTPETLTENNDYVIIADPNALSGYSIQFISANMSTGTPKTKAITIDYGTNTPVARTTVKCGTSTYTIGYSNFKFVHTDSNNLTRQLVMPRVEPNSGAFQFNFKGANATGLESMPITLTAQCDTTATDGEQLFQWIIDSGAL